MTEDDATHPGVDGDETPQFAPLEEDGAGEDLSPYEDLEEVEHDGKTFTIPRALKPALMMQADYTRKTQDLAQARKAWESERQQQAQSLESNFHERARLVAIDDRLEQLETLDWQTLKAEHPQEAQDLWAQYSQLSEARGELASVMEQQGHEEALRAQHDHAMRLQDGLEVLARDIKDWSPELAGKLADFGARELGFSPDELSSVDDPRLIKLLHRAYEGATRAHQQQRVSGIVQAQRTSPAQTLRGASGGFRVAADTNDFAAFEKLADARMK